VAGSQQGPAGEHRIRLGDLAAEELDRERGHAPQKLARDPVLRFSCDSHSPPADRRTPRSRHRAGVSSGRHGWSGERTPAVVQPEAWAAAPLDRGAGHRVSRRLRVGWATVTPFQEFGSESVIASDAGNGARRDRSGHGPRGQDSPRRACPHALSARGAARSTRPASGVRAHAGRGWRRRRRRRRPPAPAAR
jgi:hypothetical protein